MKISTTLYFDRATQQLGDVQGELTKTQEQLSTGKQIVKPSDSPDKASLVTRLESESTHRRSGQNHLFSSFILLLDLSHHDGVRLAKDVEPLFRHLAHATHGQPRSRERMTIDQIFM